MQNRQSTPEEEGEKQHANKRRKIQNIDPNPETLSDVSTKAASTINFSDLPEECRFEIFKLAILRHKIVESKLNFTHEDVRPLEEIFTISLERIQFITIDPLHLSRVILCNEPVQYISDRLRQSNNLKAEIMIWNTTLLLTGLEDFCKQILLQSHISDRAEWTTQLVSMESVHSIGVFASDACFAMPKWGFASRSTAEYEGWKTFCMVLQSFKKLETIYLVSDLAECSGDPGTSRTQKEFVAGNTGLLGAHHVARPVRPGGRHFKIRQRRGSCRKRCGGLLKSERDSSGREGSQQK